MELFSVFWSNYFLMVKATMEVNEVIIYEALKVRV